MNKPITLCDRCDHVMHCLLDYDGVACRKTRTIEPTNYDRLICKTPEEMAGLLANVVDCQYCPVKTARCAENETRCRSEWLAWLKSPADKEGAQ